MNEINNYLERLEIEIHLLREENEELRASIRQLRAELIVEINGLKKHIKWLENEVSINDGR